MTKNVGTLDRGLRVILGLGLLSLFFVLDGNERWFGIIGLVPLGTAFIGYCPAYSIIGVNSCGTKGT